MYKSQSLKVRITKLSSQIPTMWALILVPSVRIRTCLQHSLNRKALNFVGAYYIHQTQIKRCFLRVLEPKHTSQLLWFITAVGQLKLLANMFYYLIFRFIYQLMG